MLFRSRRRPGGKAPGRPRKLWPSHLAFYSGCLQILYEPCPVVVTLPGVIPPTSGRRDCRGRRDQRSRWGRRDHPRKGDDTPQRLGQAGYAERLGRAEVVRGSGIPPARGNGTMTSTTTRSTGFSLQIHSASSGVLACLTVWCASTVQREAVYPRGGYEFAAEPYLLVAIIQYVIFCQS